MSATVWTALIAGFFGVAIAAVPAWFTLRRQPSRKAQDSGALVDAAEDVVSLLRGEVERLSISIKAAHAEADAAHQLAARSMWRVRRLEQTLIGLGVDPATINGPNPSPAPAPSV